MRTQPLRNKATYTVPPMSAVPFQQVPCWDSMMVAMARHQIEHYLSIENLCKGMYAFETSVFISPKSPKAATKKHFPIWDLQKCRIYSQGFIPLMFVTAFKPMLELTPEMPPAGPEIDSGRECFDFIDEPLASES